MDEPKKVPGLHRTGPDPWDFVYNPAKGQRITFVGLNGEEFLGTVKDFTENKETGEIKLEMV